MHQHVLCGFVKIHAWHCNIYIYNHILLYIINYYHILVLLSLLLSSYIALYVALIDSDNCCSVPCLTPPALAWLSALLDLRRIHCSAAKSRAADVYGECLRQSPAPQRTSIDNFTAFQAVTHSKHVSTQNSRFSAFLRLATWLERHLLKNTYLVKTCQKARHSKTFDKPTRTHAAASGKAYKLFLKNSATNVDGKATAHVCPDSFCRVAWTRLCLSAKECAYLWTQMLSQLRSMCNTSNSLQQRTSKRSTCAGERPIPRTSKPAMRPRLHRHNLIWVSSAFSFYLSFFLLPPSRSLWETCLSPAERLPVPLTKAKVPRTLWPTLSSFQKAKFSGSGSQNLHVTMPSKSIYNLIAKVPMVQKCCACILLLHTSK